MTKVCDTAKDVYNFVKTFSKKQTENQERRVNEHREKKRQEQLTREDLDKTLDSTKENLDKIKEK